MEQDSQYFSLLFYSLDFQVQALFHRPARVCHTVNAQAACFFLFSSSSIFVPNIASIPVIPIAVVVTTASVISVVAVISVVIISIIVVVSVLAEISVLATKVSALAFLVVAFITRNRVYQSILA